MKARRLNLSFSLFLTLATVSPALAADRVDIKLENRDDQISVSVTSDLTSSYAQVLNTLHTDYNLFADAQKRLEKLGFGVDSELGLYEGKFVIQGNAQRPALELDSSSPHLAFIDRLDKYSSDVQTIVDGRGVDAFTLNGKLNEKALLVSSSNGKFGSDVGVTLSGRLVYCLIPLIDDMKVPNFLQQIIRVNCSAEKNIKVIESDLSNLHFTLSENVAQKTLPLPAGGDTLGFAFNSLAASVCPSAAVGLGTEDLQLDYKEAGWIENIDVADPQNLSKQCGYFVYNKILPRLKKSILKAAVDSSKAANPFAQDLLARIIKKPVVGENLNTRQVENVFQNLWSPELSRLSSLYNRTYDFDSATLRKVLADRTVSKLKFAEIVIEYFQAKGTGAQTPLVKDFYKLSEDQKTLAASEFANALTAECLDEIDVTLECISESRSHLNKYQINVHNFDGSVASFWRIGGLRMKETSQ